MAWTGEFQVPEGGPKRRERRFPLRVHCRLVADGGDEVLCESADVSLRGMRLEVDGGPASGQRVKVRARLPGATVWLEARVVHRDEHGRYLGLEFDEEADAYGEWSTWVHEWAGGSVA